MQSIAPYISLFALACLFGGMFAFSILFAPLVFMKLPAKDAGRFIRAVFPHYYSYVLVASSLAAASLLLQQAEWFLPVVALAITLSTVYSMWTLMPAINRLRDRELAGDARAARGFAVRHRLSVAINFLQMLAAAYVLTAFV